MKIGCLQFCPHVGEVEGNIQRAENVLVAANVVQGDLDLLVLPELAFSGYNFNSLEEITPYLEPTSAGRSTQWAIQTAQRLGCTVVIGYPEVATAPQIESKPLEAEPRASDELQDLLGRPVIPNNDPAFPYNYNSTVAIDSSGNVQAHYRKSHLYYTDATWAREGDGFYAGNLSVGQTDGTASDSHQQGRRAAMGICMDLNRKNFTAPATAFEFARHIVDSEAELAVVSMAWLNSELSLDAVSGLASLEPDLFTVSYWVDRLVPVSEQTRGDGGEVIVVLANRCGIEGDVIYAGTSTVMRLGNGEVEIFDILGKGEENLMAVDTTLRPKWHLAEKE